MHNFHDLARRAMLEYRRQPGLIDIEVEGIPALGLRYKFDEEASAGRFMLLRTLLSSYETEEHSLNIDGNDVVEIWRR